MAAAIFLKSCVFGYGSITERLGGDTAGYFGHAAEEPDQGLLTPCFTM
ncbi:hypothetical protein ACQP2T_43270 [Nonomuraea sp. CA-143628]